MSRGYLLFALDNSQTSYSRLATACALSIKATQPGGYSNVSVVTNNRGYFDPDLFDYIIPSGKLTGMDARSRAYDLTPYDQTVLLDSDLLFLTPMDHYWSMLEPKDLFISSSPQTYKKKRFGLGFYRQIFEQNQLPDVYSAYTYFNKSQTAKEFFDVVKDMTDNSSEYITKLLPNSNLTSLPTDEAFALALIVLDLVDSAVNPDWDFPRITHMKPMVQGWKGFVDDWHNKVRFTLGSNANVNIGVWPQTDILHYVNKNLITDTVLKTLKSYYD